MFRRKEDGSEDIQDDVAASTESAKPAAASESAKPAAAEAAKPSAPAFRPLPPQAAMAQSRPVTAPIPGAATAAHEPSRAAMGAAARHSQASKRVLTVGPDIQMKGEITTCDRVVIEGVVDAAMRDVHTVELTESGSLKGTAEVEDAEISGSFEGDITVRGKLTIYSTGKVRGNITFGEIEIQRGGQISGNVRNASDAKSGGTPPNLFGNKNKAA